MRYTGFELRKELIARIAIYDHRYGQVNSKGNTFIWRFMCIDFLGTQ